MESHSVRNIWAVGRNYQKHAAELGNPTPESPMIFLKAGSCIQASNDQIVFPQWVADIHHEVEVGLQLDDQLKPSLALLAIDFTERTLQSSLKKQGHPWTLAKSFSGACAITPTVKIKSLDELSQATFQLKLNGNVKQSGETADMIFTPQALVKYIQQHFPVCPGDIILTGTPEGVGPVKSGDELEVSSSFGVKHRWTIHQPKVRPEHGVQKRP